MAWAPVDWFALILRRLETSVLNWRSTATANRCLIAACKLLTRKKGEMAVANPNSGLIWEFTQLGEDVIENTMHRTLSTVAIHDGLVIAPDFAGMVHCFDATAGKKYWSYDTFASIWASPLIVGKNVYVPDEDGEVAIFELPPEPEIAMKKVTTDYYRPLLEIAHEEGIYSSPIFANHTLYIATRNKLFAIAALPVPDIGTSSSSKIDAASFRNSMAATSRVAKTHLKSLVHDDLNLDSPVFDAGDSRPNQQFQLLCKFAAVTPKQDIETGQEKPWVLKDLRKTCATYYDEHMPESAIEILGHSVGGVTYRLYAHRDPLAFKAIMTLPQPTAFSALLHGYGGECPCCRRKFT